MTASSDNQMTEREGPEENTTLFTKAMKNARISVTRNRPFKGESSSHSRAHSKARKSHKQTCSNNSTTTATSSSKKEKAIQKACQKRRHMFRDLSGSTGHTAHDKPTIISVNKDNSQGTTATFCGVQIAPTLTATSSLSGFSSLKSTNSGRPKKDNKNSCSKRSRTARVPISSDSQTRGRRGQKLTEKKTNNASISPSSSSPSRQSNPKKRGKRRKPVLDSTPSIMDQEGLGGSQESGIDYQVKEGNTGDNNSQMTTSTTTREGGNRFLCGGDDSFRVCTKSPISDTIPSSSSNCVSHHDHNNAEYEVVQSRSKEDDATKEKKIMTDDDSSIQITHRSYSQTGTAGSCSQENTSNAPMPLSITSSEEVREIEEAARNAVVVAFSIESSTGPTMDEDDGIVGDETVVFKGIGCLGPHGAMTIPMAESDIYSLGMPQEESEIDDNTDNQGSISISSLHLDDAELKTFVSISFDAQLDGQVSSCSSVATGPQPQSQTETLTISSSDVTGPQPVHIPPADDENDDNESGYYDTGVISPIEYGVLSPADTYSIENDVLLLPSHLHFCNVVADAVVGASSSCSSIGFNNPQQQSCESLQDEEGKLADEERKFADAFEEDIANEFMKTFTGFNTPPTHDSKNRDIDSMSQCSDDGFTSCATSEEEAIEVSDGGMLSSQATSIAFKARNQSSAVLVSTENIIASEQDARLASDGHCPSKLEECNDSPQNTKEPCHQRDEASDLRSSQATATPPPQLFSSQPPPSSTTSKPRLLRVAPESASHPTSAQPQQLPTDHTMANSVPLQPPTVELARSSESNKPSTHFHAKAGPGPGKRLEPLSDIILLGASQEHADNTEAALGETYQNLSTPTHSNRTGMITHRDDSNDLKADFSREAMDSTSFTYFFRNFSCHDGTSGDEHMVRNKENQAKDDKTPKCSNKEIAHTTNTDGQEEAACIDICGGNEVGQSFDVSRIDAGVDATSLADDLLASQDMTVRASNRSPHPHSVSSSSGSSIKTTTDNSLESNAMQKGSNPSKDVAMKPKELPHRGSARSSKEVTLSVSNVLSSIFSDSGEEPGADSITNNQSHASGTSKIASQGSAQEGVIAANLESKSSEAQNILPKGSSHVGKMLHSIFSESTASEEEEADAKVESKSSDANKIIFNSQDATVPSVNLETKSSDASNNISMGTSLGSCGRRSSEEVSSNSNQVPALFDEPSAEEDEEEDAGHGEDHSTNPTSEHRLQVGDSIRIAENAMFLALPKIKVAKTRRSDKNVSNSVEEVLNGLFSAPTLEESIVETLSSENFPIGERSEKVEDQFLTEITNNFFDLFNVSSSVHSSTKNSESGEADTSDESLEPDSVTRTDDDGSTATADDATLNSLDLDDIVKSRSETLKDRPEKLKALRATSSSFPSDQRDPLKAHSEQLKAQCAISNAFSSDQRDPLDEKEDQTEGERANPDTSCAAIVPYGLQPLPSVGPSFNVERPKPRMYTAFPLFPSLGSFLVEDYRLNFVKVEKSKLTGAQSIVPLLDITPALGKTLLSYKTTTNPLLQMTEESLITPHREIGAPRTRLFIQTQEEQSLDKDLTTAEKGVPLTPRASVTRMPFNKDQGTPISTDNPEWSFLDLEKSIDASLDTIINDLISPSSVDKEKALENFLSSEYCEDIVDNMRKKKEIEDALQLELDPSASDDRPDCFSNSSSSASAGRNLNSAAALLSDGDSTVPTDTDSSSLDEQSETAKKGDLNFIDGMTMGIAGLLGEDQIARLDDPQVDLPELFANEHFGSISEMVQEVHLMKAIQMEQSMAGPHFNSCSQSQISDSFEDDVEKEEDEKMQEILLTQSLQISEQRSKIEALKQELEEEIEQVHNGIHAMKHMLETQEESSHDESEEIPGWREKFAYLQQEQEKFEPFRSIDESSSCEDGCEGIEVLLEDVIQFTDNHSEQDSTCSDIDDGLEEELDALHDFEEELRQEMESVDETYSRSGSLSTSMSGYSAAEQEIILAEALYRPYPLPTKKVKTKNIYTSLGLEAADATPTHGIQCLNGSDSLSAKSVEDVIHDKVVLMQTGQRGGAVVPGQHSHSWLGQKSEMIDSCCQTQYSVSPVKQQQHHNNKRKSRMVTFSSQNEEFYFTDEYDNYFLDFPDEQQEEQQQKQTTGASASCDFISEFQLLDILDEIRYSLGFRCSGGGSSSRGRGGGGDPDDDEDDDDHEEAAAAEPSSSSACSSPKYDDDDDERAKLKYNS